MDKRYVFEYFCYCFYQGRRTWGYVHKKMTTGASGRYGGG